MAESEARKQSLATEDSLSMIFVVGLLEYVKTNNVGQLNQLLEISLTNDKKSRLNSKYEFTIEERPTHAPPIFIASALGHVEVVKLLLAHDANPNLPAEDKRTPLMVASSSNHPEVVNLLLSRGADIEAKDTDGDTCLRYANDRNNPEVIKILLEAKADPNIPGENDWTCLLIACADNYPDIAHLLLEYGADPYHVEKGGKTCLMLASFSGHIEVLTILLKSKHVQLQKLINVQSKGGWTALALAYEHPKAVELLLKHGADVNIATNQRWTPLMLACQRDGCPETVELLLEYKADPNIQGQYGLSAYTLARWNKNKRLMEILEKAGAKKTSIFQNAFSSFFTSSPTLTKKKKQPARDSSSTAQDTKRPQPAKHQSVEERLAMSLEEIQREKESLDRERRELLLTEKRNKERMDKLTLNEGKVKLMIETARRGSQSSPDEEGGDSKPPATPTTVVSDNNTEDEVENDDVIHSLGSAAKVIKEYDAVVSEIKASEQRLLLELESAKKDCQEKEQEIAKLESSREENEANIATLESDKQDQERQIEKLKEELQAQRQELDQKQREIENLKQKLQKLSRRKLSSIEHSSAADDDQEQSELHPDEVALALKKFEFPTTKWEELAVSLCIATAAVTIAADKYQSSSLAKLTALVIHWCSNDNTASWEKLIRAVYSCGEQVIAKKMAKHFEIDI